MLKGAKSGMNEMFLDLPFIYSDLMQQWIHTKKNLLSLLDSRLRTVHSLPIEVPYTLMEKYFTIANTDMKLQCKTVKQNPCTSELKSTVVSFKWHTNLYVYYSVHVSLVKCKVKIF